MRIAALLVVLASGCAAATPERPSRHDVRMLAYQKIGIVRVEDVAAPAASAPAAEPEVAATVRDDGREAPSSTRSIELIGKLFTDDSLLDAWLRGSPVGTKVRASAVRN